MKPLWCVLAVAVAVSSSALAASGWNKEAEIKNIAHNMLASDTAVACHLRTSDWRKNALFGHFVTVRMALLGENPDDDDDEVSAKAAEMFRAAKIEAALHVEFGAPTQAQCDELNKSHDMKELDSAAQIGMMAGAVNQ